MNNVSNYSREKLASLAHEQWSGWMEYLFSKTISSSDGSAIIPQEYYERWKRQMITPYSSLPDNEKESDRLEADRVIELLT